MRLTDMADELYAAPACSALPGGVRAATARHGGVTVTRVEIAREGLERPRGRYVTLEVPRVSVLDERDSGVIEQAAAELRALLPPEGPVLVLGVGNRRVTADALGPRTVQKIFVTMGAGSRLPLPGIRPVAAVAPGVSGGHGPEFAAAGRGAGAGAPPVRPPLRGQPLLLGAGAAGPDATILGHRALPGPARQPQASGRRPAGGPGARGGHPHPDGSPGGQRFGGHAPGAGQCHRPRGGPAGQRHQPGSAASAEHRAAVLAGELTA